MKKSTKIALLVAAALLVIGAVLCAVSLQSVGFDFYRLSTSNGRSKEMKKETFDAQEIFKIQLEIDIDDLHLIRSEDSQIHLQYTNWDNRKYEVSSNGGTLTVAQGVGKGPYSIQWFSFDFGDENNDMLLALPEGYAGDLQISSDVGNVELEEALRLSGSLDCQLDSGSFRADSLTAPRITVETDIGSITGSGWSAGTYLFLATQTGDIDLESSQVAGDLICQTDIGEITLSAVESGTVQLSTQTGDIHLERLRADSITASTDIGDISGTLVGVEAEYTIFTETDIGDSNLKDRAGTTQRQLELETETGDISVQFIRPD